MSNSKILSTLLAITVALTACAQPRVEELSGDATKSSQETAVQLPDPPKTENLIPFSVSKISTLGFAIDSKSLTVTPDGVVRYTLVAKSASGAENVSYEGIRCQSSEVKLYAFGHKDGTWGSSRHDKWDHIVDNKINRQHAALAKVYFCDGKTVVGSAQEILDRMRKK